MEYRFVSEQRLQSITFVDSLTGWVAGALGAIVRTTNGGVIWTVAYTTTGQLRHISFTDRLTGWAVGQNGATTVILKTMDGGSTWSDQSINTSFDAHAAAFRNGTLGWIAGADGKLLKTLDGGMHWSTVIVDPGTN